MPGHISAVSEWPGLASARWSGAGGRGGSCDSGGVGGVRVRGYASDRKITKNHSIKSPQITFVAGSYDMWDSLYDRIHTGKSGVSLFRMTAHA